MNETGSKRSIAGNVIIIVISIVLALLLIIFYSLMREHFHSYHPDVSVVEYYGENGEFDDVYYNCMKNNEKSVPDKYMDMYRQLYFSDYTYTYSKAEWEQTDIDTSEASGDSSDPNDNIYEDTVSETEEIYTEESSNNKADYYNDIDIYDNNEYYEY